MGTISRTRLFVKTHRDQTSTSMISFEEVARISLFCKVIVVIIMIISIIVTIIIITIIVMSLFVVRKMHIKMLHAGCRK